MAVPNHPLDQTIRELETRIDRLRGLYEQYFMGVERIEPHVARNDVEKRIADLRKAKFNNTAKRFKFQTLVQRYNTMQQYWTRTCREIENGTYRRQKLRAERRLGSVSEAKDRAAHPEAVERIEEKKHSNAEVEQELTELLEADVDLEKELAAALQDAQGTIPLSPNPSVKINSLAPLSSLNRQPPSTLSATSRGKTPPKSGGLLSKLGRGITPPVPSTTRARVEHASAQQAPTKRNPGTPEIKPRAPGEMSAGRIQSLHQDYLAARRKTNARDVSYEKLERKIRETEKSLRASHKGKQVDFEVTIKNGKAILKPKLK